MASVYYFFGGAQGAPRIVRRQGNTLTYLNSAHLGSTVWRPIVTVTQQQPSRTMPMADITDHPFTGQKLDGTGLMYFNARYYDREIGAFISPDTIVPDASNVFDYNRYMYVRGRVLNMNDPTGHDACGPGENPYCSEYQTAGPQNNISYQVFLAARQQYLNYVNDAGAYFGDWRTYYGVDSGDGNAAFYRLTLADVYDQYYAPGRIQDAIGAEAFFAESDRVRNTDSELAYLYGTLILGPFWAGDDDDGGPSNSSRVTIDDLIAKAAPGRKTTGRTNQYILAGGMDAADRDFDALKLDNVTEIPGIGRRGTDAEGRTIVVRNRSSYGSPTIEVQSPTNRRRIELRYE